MAPSLLLTFYTKDMEDVFKIFRAKTEKQFDRVIGYTLESLAAEPWWQEHYKYVEDDRMQLPLNPGGAKVGYWKYKSYVLLKHMRELPDEALIVYHDVNVKKYPNYMAGIDEMKATCKAILRRCGADIWLSYEDPVNIKVKHHCKAHTVRALCTEPDKLADYFEHPMFVANRILVRNTPQIRAWMEEIVELMGCDEYMAPMPDPFRHPDFKWHTGDQSVWNTYLLNKKYAGELPGHWPVLWCRDRILGSWQRCLAHYSQNSQMQNSQNAKHLSSRDS